MANRQYIGARYVPKFYEGSNGDNWDGGVSYEPLTIVQYLNESYTSKKPVPNTIGNPAQNPEYWAHTGAYNAQVESYRQSVLQMQELIGDEELETEAQTIIGAINDLNTYVSPEMSVTPEMFGAVGDGVTDDSDAIQSAIDASNIIVFDNKTYKCKNISVHNGTKLVGNDTTLVNPSTLQRADEPVFQIVGTTTTPVNGVSICGFTFKHEATSFSENGRLITVNKATNVCIINNNFVEFTGDAITIDNSGALNDADLTHYIVIKNNNFIGTNNARQGVTIFTGKNIEISDNYFYNVTAQNMPGAIDIEPWENDNVNYPIENIFIKNNYCYTTYGSFVVASFILLYHLNNVVIENNYAVGKRSCITLLRRTTKVQADFDTITIKNNILKCVNSPFNIANMGTVIIDGNVIYDGLLDIGSAYDSVNIGIADFTFIHNFICVNSIFNAEQRIMMVRVDENDVTKIIDNEFITNINTVIYGITLTGNATHTTPPIIAKNSFSTEITTSFNGWLIENVKDAEFFDNAVCSMFNVARFNYNPKYATTEINEDFPYTCQSSDYELVGTVTIPANRGFTISSYAMYNNSQPTGIRICNAENVNKSVVSNENGGDMRGVTYSGYSSSATTLYVYAKWSSTAANHVYVKGFYNNVRPFHD